MDDLFRRCHREIENKFFTQIHRRLKLRFIIYILYNCLIEQYIEMSLKILALRCK